MAKHTFYWNNFQTPTDEIDSTHAKDQLIALLNLLEILIFACIPHVTQNDICWHPHCWVTLYPSKYYVMIDNNQFTK